MKARRSSTKTPARSTEPEVPLRITLVAPPAGVTFCLQRGRDELVEFKRSSGSSVSFDFTVRAGASAGAATLRFLGPFTQGPPACRFVYVNSGTYAGERDTCWGRRAKIPLAGITAAMVKKALATPGAAIEARVPGTARDGGPACATCRPTGGWSIVKN